MDGPSDGKVCLRVSACEVIRMLQLSLAESADNDGHAAFTVMTMALSL